MDIIRFKKILGSFNVPSGKNNKYYHFVLATLDNDKTCLLYSENIESISIDLCQEDIGGHLKVINKHTLTFTYATSSTSENLVLFKLILLDDIDKPKEVSKEEIEKLFGCKVI